MNPWITVQLKEDVLAWWLDEMVNAELSAIPKLAFFLHTHFTTIASRLDFSHALYYQIKLFRYYALGSLKELSKDICMDNAMLQHLDGVLNEKGRPNENYAREFLELYTIGKGPQKGPGNYTNYTEEDIVAAAKVFSGYKQDKTFSNLQETHGCATVRLELNGQQLASQHDASVKQFSAAFNNQTIAPSETIDGRATEDAALGRDYAVCRYGFCAKRDSPPSSAEKSTGSLYTIASQKQQSKTSLILWQIC